MVAAAQPYLQSCAIAKRDADGEHFVLEGVTWAQYVAIRDAFDERPGLRMTFLEGRLELMSPSPVHENYKKSIARLLELWAVVRGVRIHGYGSTTYRDEAQQRGLEPDECYFVGDYREDGVPDLALEVALASGGPSKLEVYRGLGVREVWFWRHERLELYELVDGSYQPIEQSHVLPDVDLDALTELALYDDQAEAARVWFERLTTG